MPRFRLSLWLMASLLLAGPVLAQPSPPAAEPPKPAPAADAPAKEDAAEEAPAADGTDSPEDAAAADEPAPDEEEVADDIAGPERHGYEDTTGTLQNLDDMRVHVSVRPGTLRAKRGFTPLDVVLFNTESMPHTVRLSFQGYGSGSPVTVRSVELAPHQRLSTFLLIPAPVSSGVFTLDVPNDGTRTLGVYMDEGSAISALVLGTSKAFEAGTGIPRSENSKPPEVNARFMSVQDAPRELAAYVGYPVVMVTEDVASVPADVWSALENYAAVGGSLILGKPSRDVVQRLPLLESAPERETWNAYGFGSVYLCQSGAADCGKAVLSVSEEAKPPLGPIGPPPRWENNRFALRGGETPLLPNALVPVGRFLVLIFLFSLVVGPGGLMLARRKGPVALLIGVPAVALLTCLIIITDSVLGEGFVTHASRYSYTWLDRPRDRLVTASVAGYYANLAPEKVQLPSTSVLMAPEDLDEWMVDVSWTGGGMVADGLLPARNYMEWGELAVLPTRARLVLHKEGKGWKVQNALGAPLESGYVQLGKKRFMLPALADGAEGLATDFPTGKDADEAVRQFVSPPSKLANRSKEELTSFALPLKEGEFVARLGGRGFAPLAAMPVQLHEGIHLVRGRVDGP